MKKEGEKAYVSTRKKKIKGWIFAWGVIVLLGFSTSLYVDRAYAQDIFSIEEHVEEKIREERNRKKERAPIYPDTVLVIRSVEVLINKEIFTGGKVGESGKNGERPGLVMRFLSFREGDVLTERHLKKKIESSLIRLQRAFFFSSRTARISYDIYEDDTSEQRGIPIIVYVGVNSFFGYGFGGGIISAYVGLYDISGLVSEYYVGVNRQEVIVRMVGLMPYKTGTTIGRTSLDLWGRAFHYWILSDLYADVYFDMLLYGADFNVDVVIYPSLWYRQSVGAYGNTTVNDRFYSPEKIRDTGSPPLGETSGTMLVGTQLFYENYFSDDGFFSRYIEGELSYFFGFFIPTIGDAVSYVDIVAATLRAQIGGKTGKIHQAVRFDGGLVTTIYQSTHRPYLAKAHLRGGFFRMTAMKISLLRRGWYPDEVSIGAHGYSLSAEYRMGIFRTRFVGGEIFLFYDVGGTSETFRTLGEGTRHTVGPGITIHFFAPVELMLRLSFGMGGRLLGNTDGQDFFFGFEVLGRR